MADTLIETLLKSSLRLKKNDTLCIIYQEEKEYIQLKNEITRTAGNLEIKYYALAFQKALISEKKLQHIFTKVRGLNPNPRAIVFLIERSSETTQFRLNLLKKLTNTGKPWRIASMPGVTNGLITGLSLDMNDIKRKAYESFCALAISEKLYIRTKNPKTNQMETLEIPISKNIPMLSTGEIAPKSWGNYPSGETFILPESYKAEGYVTINGSIPFNVFKKGEWIRFQVERGRIVLNNIEGDSPKSIQAFKNLLLDSNGEQTCPNNNCIAEIGIGVNEGIDQLIGLPIFDEKKLGTFHIGIGSNHQFHGDIESKNHNDLVVINDATLSCLNNYYPEECMIIDNGKYLIEDFDFFKDLDLNLIEIPKILIRKKLKLDTDNDDTVIINYLTQRDSDVQIKIKLGQQITHAIRKIIDFKPDKEKLTSKEILDFIDSANTEMAIKFLLLFYYFEEI